VRFVIGSANSISTNSSGIRHLCRHIHTRFLKILSVVKIKTVTFVNGRKIFFTFAKIYLLIIKHYSYDKKCA